MPPQLPGRCQSGKRSVSCWIPLQSWFQPGFWLSRGEKQGWNFPAVYTSACCDLAWSKSLKCVTPTGVHSKGRIRLPRILIYTNQWAERYNASKITKPLQIYCAMLWFSDSQDCAVSTLITKDTKQSWQHVNWAIWFAFHTMAVSSKSLYACRITNSLNGVCGFWMDILLINGKKTAKSVEKMPHWESRLV